LGEKQHLQANRDPIKNLYGHTWKLETPAQSGMTMSRQTATRIKSEKYLHISKILSQGREESTEGQQQAASFIQVSL
jgi:hypothetical protein